MAKIFQINITANWGSTGKLAESIGLAAINHGWESYIAYGRQSQPSQSKLVRIGGNGDIYRHVLGSRLFDRDGLMSHYASHAFVREIDEIKPDIVHLHNIHGYYLNYPILFQYLCKMDIPVVWTLHDCWPFTGHCSHFTTAHCERWKTGCFDCPLYRSYPTSWFVDRSRKNYALKKKIFNEVKNIHIVTVSNWLKELAKQSILGTHDVRCIYNGIDTNLFRFKDNREHICKQLGIPAQSHILLSVSNVWPDSKGLPELIQLRSFLSNNYVIVLVGLQKRQIVQLPEGIIGIERTSDINELVDIYSAADVVLSLSHAESFGLTIVEGLACGTPAVVNNATALPELISSETGITVDQGDIHGLVEAIKTICRNGKGLYSEECRRRAVSMFNKDERFQDYINLYEQILCEKNQK